MDNTIIAAREDDLTLQRTRLLGTLTPLQIELLEQIYIPFG